MCDDEESNRINATALRRIDPTFLKLHGTASQVAVYSYNAATQSWDKTDTVGCLFIYERRATPKYGLCVMNRKNANNFLQQFGPDGSVVLHQPYLLLRSIEDIRNDPGDGSQAIHCIWFYDQQDCVATANILRKMGLKFEEGPPDHRGAPQNRLAFTQSQNSPAISGQQAGNVLFQILQNRKESPLPKDKIRPPSKVMTAEELETQMLHESLHSPFTPASFSPSPVVTPKPCRGNPLTKEQFVQTLVHLLQNDSEFVNKIHESYVKSVQHTTPRNNDVRRYK